MTELDIDQRIFELTRFDNEAPQGDASFEIDELARGLPPPPSPRLDPHELLSPEADGWEDEGGCSPQKQ